MKLRRENVLDEYLDAHTERDGESDHDEQVGEKRENEGAAVWRVWSRYLNIHYCSFHVSELVLLGRENNLFFTPG